MKYIVPGVPAGAQASAFMPHYNRAAASGATAYKRGLVGQPGTQAIAAPTVNTVPSPDIGDKAQAGSARSSDAPDAWYPQQYFQTQLQPEHLPPVRIYSDNLMPVPAVDARGRAALLARPQRSGRGQTQIAQPRVIPQWGPGG